MPEKRLCSKIMLQRTDWAPLTIEAEMLRGQPNFKWENEEKAGEIVAGKCDFEVWLDKRPPLLNEQPGGILEGYDPETEDLTAAIYLTGIAMPVWIGNIAMHEMGQGDQTLHMSFDGGLEIYRRSQLSDRFTATDPLIGRHHKFLLNELVPGCDIQTQPIYFGNTPKLSYLEHPERRLCTGQSTATPQPNSRLMALAANAGNIYMVVDLNVLDCDSINHVWTYHGSISSPDLIAIGGLGWQVTALEYLAAPAPHLNMLLTRIPDGTMTRGTTPHQLQHQVYVVEYDLATNVSTVTDNWYQHTHERIASRSLRYQSSGAGGTAYCSCESIGTAIPAPPDQTYGIGTRPQNATQIDLPIGSVIYNNKIRYNGTISIPTNYGLDIRGLAIYHCGYITNVYSDGVITDIYFSNLIGIIYIVRALPPGLGSASIFTYSSNTDLAAMPAPNVLITAPTWVEVEFTPGDLVNPADPVTREVCEVKVLRRASVWSGVPGYLSLDTGQVLPCMLEPGYYAFRAQTTNWADHPAPSTDKTNADAAPFVITFERPRYVCDLGRNIKQKDFVPQIPPDTWDHQQGMGYSRVETSTDSLDVAGLANTAEDNLIISNFNQYGSAEIMARYFSWGAYPHLIYSHSLVEDEGREATGTAYHFWNNQHFVGEQVITRDWLNTWGEIYDIKDTSNRGAQYPAGVSSDIFIRGSCDLSPYDIVRFGDTTPVSEYCKVDGIEPYFGTPKPLGITGFFTLITVYPAITSLWEGKRIFKLLRTNHLGRLIRYNADWTNLTVLKECTIDTTRDKDGQLYVRRDSNAPAGMEYTVEYDDNAGVWHVELPPGHIPTVPTIVLADGSKIKCSFADPFGLPLVYPIPAAPGFCYLIYNAGDNQDKTWLVFHPSMAGITIWAQYEYYSDDCYIQEFWATSKGELWACEAGNGLILRYNAADNSADIMQDLGRGQTALGAKPIFSQSALDKYWLSTMPSGYLSQLFMDHSGHIDNLPLNLSTADAIGLICKAMDSSPYVDGNGKLYIIAHNGAIGLPKELESVRYPYPAINWGMQSENIRVTYYGGVAQSDKHQRFRNIDMPIIETFAHSEYLANTTAIRATAGMINARITVEEWEEQAIILNDRIQVHYPDRDIETTTDIAEGQIISISPQFDKQAVDLIARRL